ncbi:inositol monophosphatase family protein [Facklamia sp. 7083-14-GEN3]|uniref:inositol monophosphatase family protein n=1 Tax=Facklamia sp. 7083-14-GEN3 TaxID=2973478 RepID=UPI00215D40BE|nr:inositol monophosphatase family protein [Facklamia sp. 7083-14-GEN3]MCR8969257.1 inositol monophosphatase family protein [Facklamia sp. 7083-14-GEN3]
MDFQIHQRVMSWLKTAGDSLIASLNTNLMVKEKTNASDLVTRMDKEVEEYLTQQINIHYPDHRVLSEEGKGHSIKDTQGVLWIIDPIDGTLNFVKQGRFFGIMIGIYVDGQPLAGYIYDVMQEDLYYGIVGQGAYLNDRPLQPLKINSLSESLMVTNAHILVRNQFNSQDLLRASLGSRSYGCAAYEMISVIRGESAFYLASRLMPWDFAAGVAILESLGFKYSQPNGKALNLLTANPGIFCNGAVYEEVLQIVNLKEN